MGLTEENERLRAMVGIALYREGEVDGAVGRRDTRV